MKILKRILKGPHEDLVRSLKILERFSPGSRKGGGKGAGKVKVTGKESAEREK